MAEGRIVRQNGAALVKISEDLAKQAGELKALYDQFFDEIDTNLSATDESKIWWGVRANGCKEKAKTHRPTFDEMKKAIIELANTINDHANTFGTMDSSGY